jgi:hypothetical protein
MASPQEWVSIIHFVHHTIDPKFKYQNPNFKSMTNDSMSKLLSLGELDFGFHLKFELWHLTFNSASNLLTFEPPT